MKCLFKTLVAIALGAGAAIASAQSLKLGHETPPTHVFHKVAEKIAAELDKASDGTMKVAVNPLNKLGSQAQVINLMQAGAVQFGVYTAAELSNREPSLQAWSLPYVFKDVAHATRAAGTPAAREMLKKLAPNGVIGLGYAFAGQRHVLSVEPVKSPKDLVGKKVRAFPSPVYNDFWNAAGAAPTAMPLSEIAPSLTTKLLDAVDIDLDALVGLKFYQQAPNLTLTNHMAFPAVIVVSKKWFDSRSDAERAMIVKVVAESEKWGYEAAIAADKANLEKAQADGVKVHDFDRAAFEAIGKTIREKYIASNPLIADFYKQAKDL